MRHTTVAVCLLVLGITPVAGQRIHKHERLYVEHMPYDIDTLIKNEISLQRVPLEIVDSEIDAVLVMRETSGFDGTTREEDKGQGIHLTVEIFDSQGQVVWPVSAGTRFYYVKNLSPGWQSTLARHVVARLRGSVQMYTSSDSVTESWWPWSKKDQEKRIRYTSVDPDAGPETQRRAQSAPINPASEALPAEVEMKRLPAERAGQVDVRFSHKVRRVETGMTTGQVQATFGDPMAIAQLDKRTIYRYPGMVVEFEDGKVADVRFP